MIVTSPPVFNPKHTVSGTGTPVPGQQNATLRLQIDFHSHRLLLPSVHASDTDQAITTPRTTPQPPQRTPSSPSPTTPNSGPSSSKASWSSLLSAASYRNLLGGGNSGGSGGNKKPKATITDSRRPSTVDELALANGSITPDVAAAIAELRRRRTVKPDATQQLSKIVEFPIGGAGAGTGITTPAAAHVKTRSDSFHSQTQSQPMSMRFNHAATLPHFHRRLPSLSSVAAPPRIPSTPVKIHAIFYDPPAKELT